MLQKEQRWDNLLNLDIGPVRTRGNHPGCPVVQKKGPVSGDIFFTFYYLINPVEGSDSTPDINLGISGFQVIRKPLRITTDHHQQPAWPGIFPAQAQVDGPLGFFPGWLDEPIRY